MKCMVYGGIQTILSCIFDKFIFPTKAALCYENDAKFNDCTPIYFPVLTLLSELSNPIYFEFFMYSYKILISITFL